MDILLKNHLCFKLYVGSRLITQLFADALSRHDLTYPKYLVLVALHENDGLTVSELGERLYLDSGTLSPLLSSLVKSGYISRERISKDQRIVSNFLTRSGRTIRAKAAADAFQVYCGTGVPLKMLQSLRDEMDLFIHHCEISLKSGSKLPTKPSPKQSSSTKSPLRKSAKKTGETHVIH